jgi:short-subunit dehydrogenase
VAARHGYDVILVARSTDKLEQVAAAVRSLGRQAFVVSADLSRPDGAAEVARAAEAIGPVDVLINSAGFGDYGRFADRPWDVQASMLRVNVVALTELTRQILPGMIARRHGRILNLGSTASFQPAPWFGVYAGTKAYVLYFSEALHEELKGTGVSVTALCPGSTATGFHDVAKTGASLLNQYVMMKSGPVAEAGWEGMMRGKAVVVPGWFNKLNAWLIGFFPRVLSRKMAAVATKPR